VILFEDDKKRFFYYEDVLELALHWMNLKMRHRDLCEEFFMTQPVFPTLRILELLVFRNFWSKQKNLRRITGILKFKMLGTLEASVKPFCKSIYCLADVCAIYAYINDVNDPFSCCDNRISQKLF
jgi:hypothetical protein